MFFRNFEMPMSMLHDEMNRLFNEYLGEPAEKVHFPLVNIWGTENEVLVCAELPGVNPNDVNIHVMEDTLTIDGQRKGPEVGDGKEKVVYHRQERNLGNFKRTLKLPFRAEPDKVEAKYEKGILEVRLPRAERDKPRQIKVQSAS